MKYNITLEDLKTVNHEIYKNIVGNEHEIDFFSLPGREHYKLLSFFSTLFNNSNIIDIGTHLGHSSLALSYNKSNTIYTFDIVDKVRPAIKKVENIKFCMDNLFDKNVFDKWKDIILSCPFIFLDVDPHNGTMETEIMGYLKEINYDGFIICDDIWYFKEMRDHFWYKIEDKYRYDLTNLGHWSGTGIITFNKDIVFEKNDVSNWTLVTAYFNLTKCMDASNEIRARDKNFYMNSAISTLSLPYNLVIYCDEESYDEIKKIRPEYLNDKTHYKICEFEDFGFIKNGVKCNEVFFDYRWNIIENREKFPYHFDNRNTASYYLFCMARYAMLKEVISMNLFNSTHFGWINFCIERMGFKNLIHLEECLAVNRDKFSTCYIDYIPESLVKNTQEYFKWGRCSMCSGFFTGNADYMYRVCDLIENKFLHYLSIGYGHADEQLYSPVYFENPELFEHYYGDYQQMITNYKYIYDAPEPPVHNFIRNSFVNKNYKLCLDACKFVMESIRLEKCFLNSDYLKELHNYYEISKNVIKNSQTPNRIEI
jgi:hypothetical protein